MIEEILFEKLPYGIYQIEKPSGSFSEALKFNATEFNKLYTNRVRLPDGKGNVIYLMTDTFEHSLKMINSRDFVIPPTYRKIFFPYWHAQKFLNRRIVISTKQVTSDRRKMIKNDTKLVPYATRTLSASTDNIMFCTCDIVAAMSDIMNKTNVRKNYKEFFPAYMDCLKSMTPAPKKVTDDVTWNNRLILVDCSAFRFKPGASVNDNKSNPLFLLYLSYIRNKGLADTKIDIDMLIYSSNLFMKFNPSRITDMSAWGLFKRALFRIMGANLDEYIDQLSDDDKLDLDDSSSRKTVSNIVKDAVGIFTQNASQSAKQVLADTVEDKLVKKIGKISAISKELKKAGSTGSAIPVVKSTSFIHTDPLKSPLDTNREKVFDAVSRGYAPPATKSSFELDDDYDDYYDDVPEDDELSDDDASAIEDDAIDILTSDDTIAEELLDDIQDRKVPMSNPKTAPVNSARDRKLREEQRKVVVKNSTIGEILERDSSNVPIQTEDKSKVMHTSNQNMKSVTYANFNKTYIDELYTKDLLACFNSLQDKDSPFYITGIDIKDNSDALNYIDTWSVHIVDENKKRSTIKVDIPKFQDNRFMYLEGTRWIIQMQNFYNPLVKDTPDTVILTTNYNKVTIRRNSTRSLSIVERIYSLIKKTGDTKMFVTGNSSQGNMKYISTLEYDELSKSIFQFISGNCNIYFSRDYIKEHLSDNIPKDIKGDEFYIGNEGETPILINEDTGLDRLGRTIGDIIEENLPDEYKEIFGTIKGTTQTMYAEGKLAGHFLPVITTLILWVGLKATLNMMNIYWQFHAGMKRIPQSTSSRKYIKFADGILEYESKIFAELLLNGLLKMKPNKLNFDDFETEVSYGEYIYSIWGSYNGIIELKNFHEFLVDPITKEVCRDFMLPETSPELLIRAVQLLADNQFVSKASDKSYRVRSVEQIAAILYFCLANQYKKYVKTGRRIPMTLNQGCVISALRSLKTVEAYSTLNPVIEVGQTHSISTKGYRGSNSEFSYKDEKKRSYDPSSVGKLAISTSADANVGINKNLVVEPTIINARGYRKPVDDIDELKDVNVFSPVELLTPGSARMDDPIRTAIAVKQSSHVVPVKDACPALVSNGFDEAIQFHLSDDFVINAEEDGKVIDINDELGFIMVQYKSGKTKAIYTKPEIVKNSGGGFYMSNQLVPTHAKIGEKFSKDEPLAYHPKYFQYSKLNGLRYSIGPMVKMAIASSFNTYEDGGICTEELSEKMITNIVYQEEPGRFKRNYNIIDMVKIGDHVNVGDTLIKYDISSEDDELTKFLGRLSDGNADLLADEARNDIKAQHAGTVVDIQVSSLLEPENLSPSLGKLVQQYFDVGNKKKEYLEKFDSSEGIMKSGYMLTDSTKPLKNKYNSLEGDKGVDVRVKIFIEHSDTMGVGDKVAQYNANKQIISQLIPKGWEPYSEFRPEEIISSLSSPGTIARRMTPSVLTIMAANKVLIELKRKIDDITKSRFNRKAIENLLYSVYDALDPSGNNTDKFKMIFAPMSDKEFEKFIRDIVGNKNENFTLDIVEFEHMLKFEYCEKAADVLGIPLMEYVYMPHLSMDKSRVIVTKEKCLVGYINIKRTQQLLAKKNGLSLSNEKRSATTGQVVSTSTHKDKNARDSDIEATMLVSLGADKILQELHGPRADDLHMKLQMNKSIATKGYVLLDELDNLSTNKVTLNTVNTYLLGMMIKSDLVSPTYILPKTSDEMFESVDNTIPYAAWM